MCRVGCVLGWVVCRVDCVKDRLCLGWVVCRVGCFGVSCV